MYEITLQNYCKILTKLSASDSCTTIKRNGHGGGFPQGGFPKEYRVSFSLSLSLLLVVLFLHKEAIKYTKATL